MKILDPMHIHSLVHRLWIINEHYNKLNNHTLVQFGDCCKLSSVITTTNFLFLLTRIMTKNILSSDVSCVASKKLINLLNILSCHLVTVCPVTLTLPYNTCDSEVMSSSMGPRRGSIVTCLLFIPPLWLLHSTSHNKTRIFYSSTRIPQPYTIIDDHRAFLRWVHSLIFPLKD